MSHRGIFNKTHPSLFVTRVKHQACSHKRQRCTGASLCPSFQHPDLKDLKVARCAGIPVKEKLHSSSPLTLTTLARLSHPRNQEHFLSFRRSSQKHPQTLGRKDGRAVQQVSGLDQYTDHMLECSGSEFIVYWRGSDTSSEIPLRSFLAQETVLHVGVVWGVIMIALTVF